MRLRRNTLLLSKPVRSGRDEPAGGGEADLPGLNIGIKGGSDGRDDFPAHALVRFLQDETHRTEVGEVGDEVRLRKSARDVQTLKVNSGPTGFPEDSADTVGVGQGELAGRIRAPWRDVLQ